MLKATGAAWRSAPVGGALTRRYRTADLLVHASRLESYGMVVSEALGFGIPVVATAVGGVPEALGRTAEGLPGLLVPPDDPAALYAFTERATLINILSFAKRS